MKVARAELLRRVAELGQRRDEQEKLLQRLEVRTDSKHLRAERVNFEYVSGCGPRQGTRLRP